MGTKTRHLSNTIGKDIQWQSVRYADGSTIYGIDKGQGYLLDTTGGQIEIVLPASPQSGDTVGILDFAGTFATNRVILSGNGSKIRGLTIDAQLNTNNTVYQLTYIDDTEGWIVIESKARTALAENDPYIPPSILTAEGGCKTIDGEFAVHTFTSSGCFVVSCVCSCSSPGNVDYIVVAGGGGQGYTRGGGGGAGGFREGKQSAEPNGPSHTASPLATGSGITVSASPGTYPITIGAAGGAAPPNGYSAGSPSTFSNITSAGGGGGGSAGDPPGQSGGSGGGAGAEEFQPYQSGSGGGGNSPPVSPPQGTGGGSVSPGPGGAGGGGATQSGQGGVGGNGGDGAQTAISGTAVYYSGGGGGQGNQAGVGNGCHGLGQGTGKGAGQQGVTKVPCEPTSSFGGSVVLRYRIYAPGT